ncbi:MAG: hypothetical protein MSG64_01310 [Pyrinomonadaceae bacterium MAG19_C2-C3]|nr:hypothetical protein [Pyrinomonadaceae bacterium MAG19_C2-C3]
MSIANELSSDVAAAMIASHANRFSGSAHNLTRIVLELHSTLQRLNRQSRRRLSRRDAEPHTAPPDSAFAHGGNH